MNVATILQMKGSAVLTVTRSQTLGEAAMMLRDNRVGALVVADDGRTIDGILSERDIVRSVASHGSTALGRSVAETMTRDVVTCTMDDTVDVLMQRMTESRIRHIPVVDPHLAGIISIGDVVKVRLAQLHTENEALHQYLHQGLG